jgi:hypothetical protein
VQVGDALHFACGDAEEKRQGSRRRTELGPIAEEYRCSGTLKLQGGRRDTIVRVEENTVPPSASRQCHVVR